MPLIQAIYHNTDSTTGTVDRKVETGLNANERVSGNIILPAASIRKNIPILADLMDKLKEHGWDVYSCAETQALAKLLEVVSNPDFRKIIFTKPNINGEMEFWNPCENCQNWLTGVGNWGKGTQYRLSNSILDALQPQNENPFLFDLQNRELFPPLQNTK